MSEYVVDIVIGEERHLFGVVDEFVFEKCGFKLKLSVKDFK